MTGMSEAPRLSGIIADNGLYVEATGGGRFTILRMRYGMGRLADGTAVSFVSTNIAGEHQATDVRELHTSPVEYVPPPSERQK